MRWILLDLFIVPFCHASFSGGRGGGSLWKIGQQITRVKCSRLCWPKELEFIEQIRLMEGCEGKKIGPSPFLCVDQFFRNTVGNRILTFHRVLTLPLLYRIWLDGPGHERSSLSINQHKSKYGEGILVLATHRTPAEQKGKERGREWERKKNTYTKLRCVLCLRIQRTRVRTTRCSIYAGRAMNKRWSRTAAVLHNRDL